jgi:tetratricopeptide (TPR) repeat protein
MRGHFGRARTLLTKGNELLGELGLGLSATTSLTPGIVEMLAGDVDAAERSFRASFEALGRAGERNIRATAAAYLARALYQQGRYDEAYEVTRVSEDLAPEDDFATMLEWASTRAKVLARRGEWADAERLSQRAVSLAAGTDEIEAHATTLLDRAEVLAITGSTEKSRPHIEKALELYARKGDVASAERARALLQAHGLPAVVDLREEQAAPH